MKSRLLSTSNGLAMDEITNQPDSAENVSKKKYTLLDYLSFWYECNCISNGWNNKEF